MFIFKVDKGKVVVLEGDPVKVSILSGLLSCISTFYSKGQGRGTGLSTTENPVLCENSFVVFVLGFCTRALAPS